MLKYILGVGGTAFAALALYSYLTIGGLQSDLTVKEDKIIVLQQNAIEREAQVTLLQNSIEFLTNLKDKTELANIKLAEELEQAENREVPVEIRTVTQIVESDPIQAQIIVQEGMTDVLKDLETASRSLSD